MSSRRSAPSRRPRRAGLVTTAVVLAVVSAACTQGRPSSAPPGEPAGRPRVMAAVGDSITRAFAACGRGGDCAESSWATGTDRDVRSHWQRLEVEGGGNHNVAVSGARVAGLEAQVRAAVARRPDYVTVLIGANDACARDESAMTPVEDFARAFRAALDALVTELPNARVLVLSVPDLLRLWEIGRGAPEVRRSWASTGVCQSMLAEPADTRPAAQERRDRVRQRVREYNDVMAAACTRHADRCRHDAGAVFAYRFTLADVSTVDYWHPSSRGQATLAEVAWKAGFWP